MNRLPIMGIGPQGVLLGTREKHVILPPHEAPDGLKRGDILDVFVYCDMPDELTATLTTPEGQVGDFVLLRIVDSSEPGAFADWGLAKDLLIPRNKQHTALNIGDSVVVAIVLDPRSQRCFGSTWLKQYMSKDPEGLKRGDKVSFLVYGSNQLGALGVVDNAYSGLVPRPEFAQRPLLGAQHVAYVQRIAEDGKIDCTLRPPGAAGRDADERRILEALELDGGRLMLTDKSSPHAIKTRLKMSKKAFKRAVGGLYRQRLVNLRDDAIVLARPDEG